MIRSIVVASCLSICAMGTAQADITVSDAWVRASLPQQRATGAFMTISAGAHGARLVGARSTVAAVTEVHEMKLVDNIARMGRVEAVDVGPGQVVELKPGSYHIMLMELKQPVQVGDTVELELIFEQGGATRSVPVTAVARPLTGAPMKRHH
ncbi:MAG: copper chaperone PCu(A)C [Rhodocyclaceae bacterium]|nr:copper chaperone PCu(A)C [Rhodocyclaceae bacterium]